MYRIYTGVVCAVSLLGALAPSCWADVEEEFSQTIPLNANGEFEISNVNGSIAIESWNRNEVQITATKSAKTEAALREIEVNVEGSGDRVEVDTELPKGRNLNASVAYRIVVPASVELEVETVNGQISVDGVSGEIEVSSVNGQVSVTGAAAPVDAETVNGQMTVRYAATPQAGEHQFETVNGAVTVYLPGHVSGNFRGATVNGAIRTDFPLEVTKARYGPTRSLRGELGSNAAATSFSFETVNGAVSIHNADANASNER